LSFALIGIVPREYVRVLYIVLSFSRIAQIRLRCQTRYFFEHFKKIVVRRKSDLNAYFFDRISATVQQLTSGINPNLIQIFRKSPLRLLLEYSA
jgi:hypothetical protein